MIVDDYYWSGGFIQNGQRNDSKFPDPAVIEIMHQMFLHWSYQVVNMSISFSGSTFYWSENGFVEVPRYGRKNSQT